MNHLQTALWFVAIVVGVVFLGFVMMQISGALLPFAIAAFLAYLTNPMVEFLTSHKVKLPRTLAVTIVFVLVIGLVIIGLFLVIPALIKQSVVFMENLPEIMAWGQDKILPYLGKMGVNSEQFNIEALKSVINSHQQEATVVAKWFGNMIYHSGLSLFAGIMQTLIVMVVTFYLLRDWHQIIANIKSVIPSKKVIKILQSCNTVLATFLRGQLSVMLALAVFYTVGLALVGVHFALLLGVVIGILSIVPYLGSILGLAVGLVVALVQFQEWTPLVYIFIIFGVGHILEGMVLTPLLIGDKLGLHPVVVIFAVLAGGQLLGVMGVVLALPIAAILVVILSDFYRTHGLARA